MIMICRKPTSIKNNEANSLFMQPYMKERGF